MSLFQSLDPPFSLLATTFRVDKDEQRMGVCHRADLLNDTHVLVMFMFILSSIFFLSKPRVEQQKKTPPSIKLQKTAHEGCCLQLHAKMLSFSFLLKMRLCWTFHVSHTGISEVLVPVMTSQKEIRTACFSTHLP